MLNRCYLTLIPAPLIHVSSPRLSSLLSVKVVNGRRMGRHALYTFSNFFFNANQRPGKLHRTLSNVINHGFACSAVAVIVVVALFTQHGVPGPHVLRHIFLLGLMIHGVMTVCGGNYWLDMPFFFFTGNKFDSKTKHSRQFFPPKLQSDAIQNTLPPPKKKKTRKKTEKDLCSLSILTLLLEGRTLQIVCLHDATTSLAGTKVGQTDTPQFPTAQRYCHIHQTS